MATLDFYRGVALITKAFLAEDLKKIRGLIMMLET
jgi:hypothetical protein